MSKMELLFRIKDENGCSNMGGIAIDGSGTLYCVKSSSDDENQCLYVINNYERAKKTNGFVNPLRTHKYKRLGHANSLTLSGGYLYVGTNENYIVKLSTTKLKGTTHETGEKIVLKKKVKQTNGKYKLTEVTDISISSIANINGNKFVLHFSKPAEDGTNRIYFNKDVKSYTEKTPKGEQKHKYIDIVQQGSLNINIRMI